MMVARVYVPFWNRVSLVDQKSTSRFVSELLVKCSLKRRLEDADQSSVWCFVLIFWTWSGNKQVFIAKTADFPLFFFPPLIWLLDAILKKKKKQDWISFAHTVNADLIWSAAFQTFKFSAVPNCRKRREELKLWLSWCLRVCVFAFPLTRNSFSSSLLSMFSSTFCSPPSPQSTAEETGVKGDLGDPGLSSPQRVTISKIPSGIKAILRWEIERKPEIITLTLTSCWRR